MSTVCRRPRWPVIGWRKAQADLAVLLEGEDFDGVFSPRMTDGVSLIEAVACKKGILIHMLATPSGMLERPRLLMNF